MAKQISHLTLTTTITVLLLLLPGCSIISRKHLPGYYIQISKSTKRYSQRNLLLQKIEDKMTTNTHINITSIHQKDQKDTQLNITNKLWINQSDKLSCFNKINERNFSKITLSNKNRPLIDLTHSNAWYKKIIEENSKDYKRNKLIPTTQRNTPIDREKLKKMWESCDLDFDTALRLVLLFGYAGAHYWYARKYLAGCLNTFVFLGVITGIIYFIMSPPIGLMVLLFYGIPDFIWWRIDINRIKTGGLKPECYQNEIKYQSSTQKTKEIIPVYISSGSRADGILKATFTYNSIIKYQNKYDPTTGNVYKVPYEVKINPFNNDDFEIDKNMMHEKLLQRCKDWGYNDYRIFEEYKNECVDYREGACFQRKITFDCQCINSEKPSIKPENNNSEMNATKPDVIATGTGFLLSNQGYVVTNYHVINMGKQFFLFDNNSKKEIPLVLISQDINNDLAILKIDDESFISKLSPIPYSISNSTPKMGEEVFVIGYPSSQYLGKEPKFADGKISATSGILDDQSTMQLTVPVHPGNSGSPVFNKKGEIIGIISSKFTKGENVCYAIKKEYLVNLLNSNNIEFHNKNTIYNKEITEKAAAIKNYIFLLLIK